MIGRHPRPGEDHVRRSRELADALLPALRELGRRYGYAVATHGTMERDIDLIAVPWRDGVVEAQQFVEAVFRVCDAVIGIATGPGGWTRESQFNPPPGALPNPEKKPHGRLCWVIMLGGAQYIDLSVMPRESTEKAESK